MGTKNNPGEYDCYNNAEPDEPMFVLLARDSSAPEHVLAWAKERLQSDRLVVAEAIICAGQMMKWRMENR